MKIYNGEGLILGRMATVIANEKTKRARKGYPLKSAKFSRLPDRFVRRTIRGMLPWKITRGKEAYKRVMCYIGIPEVIANEKIIILEKASAKKLPTLKYITVGEVCKALGGKV